ncbi:MAG TPA: hypothetical protein VNW52_02625 [Burkholderiaceae bacterium]|jgi:uncharacterized membrane protein|nr:hypothetical protein [Burkholderiaceae bacterium]
MDWMHVGPTTLTSFLASLVECVEALTVVLAVGMMRGWRSALTGAVLALLTLLALVIFFGQSLSHIPLQIVRLVVGTLLLLFGLRWLRKAILRAAGVIALHDELAIYAREKDMLSREVTRRTGAWDKVAVFSAFKIVMLEGLEVVFIVIALGAGGQMTPAAIGALAALLLVVVLGFLVHRPLSMVPENALKMTVGIIVTGFGTYWVGEGIQLAWPGDDWAVIGLSVMYAVIAYLLVSACRHRAMSVVSNDGKAVVRAQPGKLIIYMTELISLFVDDAHLAAGAILWVGVAWIIVACAALSMFLNCALFCAGFLALLAYSALRQAGETSTVH